jgi:hypothetical protein
VTLQVTEVRGVMRDAGWHEAAVTVPAEEDSARNLNPSILLEFSFKGLDPSSSSVDVEFATSSW